ncbi:unnamed protein product [Calypogeia fissa]
MLEGKVEERRYSLAGSTKGSLKFTNLCISPHVHAVECDPSRQRTLKLPPFAPSLQSLSVATLDLFTSMIKSCTLRKILSSTTTTCSSGSTKVKGREGKRRARQGADLRRGF